MFIMLELYEREYDAYNAEWKKIMAKARVSLAPHYISVNICYATIFKTVLEFPRQEEYKTARAQDFFVNVCLHRP